jgi:hypothetical protein
MKAVYLDATQKDVCLSLRQAFEQVDDAEDEESDCAANGDC